MTGRLELVKPRILLGVTTGRKVAGRSASRKRTQATRRCGARPVPRPWLQRLRSPGDHRCRRGSKGFLLQPLREQGGNALRGGRAPQLKRLRGHFEYLAKRHHGNGYQRGCLLGNLSAEVADTNRDIRKVVDDALQRWSDAVTSVLQEAQAKGQIRAELRPKVLGRYLVSSWEGALLRMKALKSRAPLDDFFSVTFGLLLA